MGHDGFGALTMDLSVRIGRLHLRNPFIAASGCFGYGLEYAHAIDLSTLGGVAVKGLFLEEREGHAPPRIVETPAGMLNAIGLQGIGVHRFVAEKLPELRRLGATTIVNICGSTLDEYCEVARVLFVPLADLLTPGTYREELWGSPPLDRSITFFELDDETIWGATARMLAQLLGLALGIEA